VTERLPVDPGDGSMTSLPYAPGLAPVAGADRLSLSECRRLLTPGAELSDDELERLRDDLYRLAEVTIDAACGGRLRSRK
jgi:hypothetical protein